MHSGCYWKTENVEEIQRHWGNVFETNKLKADRNVYDVIENIVEALTNQFMVKVVRK
jgi:hypothetical protein